MSQTLLQAILDATSRGWRVEFVPDVLPGTIAIDGIKIAGGQKWCSRRCIRVPDLKSERDPDHFMAFNVELATNDRQIPQPPKPTEGWAFPLNSRKAHYIVRGMSLCHKMGYLGSQLEQGNDDSMDNCAECQRRLTKHKGSQ